MKIGIYVCSNGYGHFHRMLQVCTHLPFCEIDIHCERYQYNRFKPNQDKLKDEHGNPIEVKIFQPALIASVCISILAVPYSNAYSSTIVS